jgi:hypothetical protein
MVVMPDIHHDVPGQVRHMQRREMFDCVCGALIPVRSLLGSIGIQRATNASERGGEDRPAKVDAGKQPLDSVY